MSQDPRRRHEDRCQAGVVTQAAATDWRKVQFSVICERGLVTIDAWCSPAAPGVMIHPTLAPLSGWTVSHESTGRAMIRGLGNSSRAQAAALEVARLADWTRPLDQLKADGLDLVTIMDGISAKHGGGR